jgi:gliding motility-associated-like protein
MSDMQQKLRCLSLLLLLFPLVLFAQPVANFTASPTSGCAPLTVTFDGSTSNGSNLSYNWTLTDSNNVVVSNLIGISPTFPFTAPGCYDVLLTVTSSPSSQSDTFFFPDYICVNNGPAANFQITTSYNDSGCAPMTVCFTDLSSPSSTAIVSWIWDFGDGGSSNQQNPCYVYNNFINPAGTPYDVTLVVVDAQGCVNTVALPDIVVVAEGPSSSFVYSTDTSCTGPYIVDFTNLSTGNNIQNFQWNFGGATPNTFNGFGNPTGIEYGLADTFTVRLITITTSGCRDTFYGDVLTDQSLIFASFTADTTSGCANIPIQFTNTSTPTPATTFWTFTGPVVLTSNQQNPSMSFPTAGTYDVKMVTTNSFGCTDSVTIPNYISILSSPTANFSADTTVGCGPLAVTFTDLSTPVTGSGIMSWNWSFIGAVPPTSNVQSPPIINYPLGNFSVMLTVIDSNGCQNTYNAFNFIQNSGPNAAFTASPPAGCAPLVVNFGNQSTTPINTTITSYQWIFPGGTPSTSTIQTPSVTYSATGTYPDTLIVTNSLGCIDTTVLSPGIVVSPHATPDFVASPLQACWQEPVSFNNNTTGTVTGVTYSWYLNNTLFFSSSPNPVYTNWPDTGCYDIRLIVNNAGCMDTLDVPDYICINAPKAVFNFPTISSCTLPLTVNFLNLSVNSNPAGNTYQWDFSYTGNTLPSPPTSTATNPSATYTVAGPDTIQLIVNNSVTGCSDTAYQAIYVGDPIPGGGIISSDTSFCTPKIINFDNGVPGTSVVTWYFQGGNPSTSTQQSPNVTYLQPNNLYDVTMIVETPAGCLDTITEIGFISTSGPLIEIYANDSLRTAICVHDTVTFDAVFTSQTAVAAYYVWNFASPNTTLPPGVVPIGATNTQTVQCIYDNAGVYNIRGRVVDIDSCADAKTTFQMVYVDSLIMSATADFNFACSNFPINFSCYAMSLLDSLFSQTVNYSYLWDFGDNTTSTLQNPTHVYLSTGTYSATVTVTTTIGQYNLPGCSQTVAIPFTIQIYAPNSAFTATSATTSTCPPLQVCFAGPNPPAGDTYSYFWNFGDPNNTTSSLQNPCNIYTVPGQFDVTLVVLSNNFGCYDTTTYTAFVSIEGPIASFSFDPDTGCAPLTTTFFGVIQNSAFGFWFAGDGQQPVQSNYIPTQVNLDTLSLTYSQPGVFYPLLILTDTSNGFNCTVTYTSPTPVVVDPLPSAGFSVDTASLCFQGCVQFTDTSISSQTILTWFWDFGDGNTSVLQNPSNCYTSPGNYDVTLIIQNAYGCIDTTVMANFIIVHNLPTAVFVVSDTLGCVNFPVTFTDLSVGPAPITGWIWDFGDLASDTIQNPTHIYTVPNTYTATMIAIDQYGCRDTASYFPIYALDTQPPTPPRIRVVTVLDNFTDSIAWETYVGIDFGRYILYRDGSPIYSTTNINQTSFVDIGINTTDTNHCYQLTVEDVCGIQTPLDSALLNCTIDLQGTPAINSVVLSWNPYTDWINGVSTYDIFRVYDYNSASDVYLTTVAGNVTTYLDLAAECPRTYHYRVRANENGGNAQVSYSDTMQVEPIYQPPNYSAYLFRASVDNNQDITVTWEGPPITNGYIYLLDKSLDNTNWTQIAVIPWIAGDVTYLDTFNDLTPVDVQTTSYYYRVALIDTCGWVFPYSNFGVSMVLETKLVNKIPTLTWSPYASWYYNVDYYAIELWDSANAVWTYVDQVPNTVFKYEDRISDIKQPNYCYRIRANELLGREADCYSNTDCTPIISAIYSPNAFSPNGDGANDVFNLVGVYVGDYSLLIYDRWGNEIYTTNSTKTGWDGTNNGKSCPEGVYVFRANGIGYDGRELEMKGSVTLIR